MSRELELELTFLAKEIPEELKTLFRLVLPMFIFLTLPSTRISA